MTIVNVAVRQDAVHVFTDTLAVYPGNGVMGHVAKVMPLLHLNAVIATRGSVDALAKVASIISLCASNFEELKDRLADELYREAKYVGQADIFVAGWANRRAEAFAIFTHSLHGVPAWKPFEIPYVLLTPTIPDLIFRTVATADPIDFMPRVMNEQARAHPAIVGGTMQRTTISANGISMKTLGEIGR